MPQYWLTTHWPPVRSSPQDNDRLNVHIQHKFKDYLSSMQPGDRVLFYETATGPPKLINGKLEKRENGRKAIVCDARVATPLELRPEYEPEEFNGRILDFRWQARTDDRRDLLIPRAAVIEWLGYGKGYTFQGFNAGRGILRIDETKYIDLLRNYSGRQQ